VRATASPILVHTGYPGVIPTVLSKTSIADGTVAQIRRALSRQRIELVGLTQLAYRQQLTPPDHVHQFDAGKRYCG